VTALLLLTVPGCAQKPDEAAIMRQNAAEQAAALHQDPGGADRDRLLKERAREPIYAGRPDVRSTHPDAQWFGKRPIGLFLHWGISSVHGGVDISWAMIKNMGAGTKLTPREYWALADRFKAERYDPETWLRAAKAAGFDYAVLTAKHHDGYTHWPTATTEMGVRNKLPGHDHVETYVEACRKVGLKVGLYFSGPDWWQDREVRSFNYRSEGPGGSNSSLPPIPGRKAVGLDFQEFDAPGPSPELTEQIRKNNRQQLTELLSNYGRIDLLWFDGGSGSDITVEEIRALQPGIVINNRGQLRSSAAGQDWPGDYFSVEHGEPVEPPPGWWEQLRIWNAPFWGYSKKNELSCTPTADILASLAKSRAWGGALMANWGPRPDGTLPDTYYRSMRDFGEWMKANGASIAGTEPAPAGVQANVPITARDDTWYLHLIAASGGKASVTPGPSIESVSSATILASGEAVPFEWRSGVLHVDRRAPAPDQAHEVVAVRVARAR
jgi:alpha-L-fucosidase